MAACQWISPEDASPKSLRTPLGTSWALQGCFILTSIWSIWGSWTHEVEQVYELLASVSDLSCIFVDLATVYYISKWEIWRLELVNPVCICLTLYFVYLVIVNMSHPATALSWYNPSQIVLLLSCWRVEVSFSAFPATNKMICYLNIEYCNSSLCCISTCAVFLQLLSSVSIIRLFIKTAWGLANAGSSELPINSSHEAGSHASVVPGVHSDSLTTGYIWCTVTHERRGEAGFTRVSETRLASLNLSARSRIMHERRDSEGKRWVHM